MADQPEYSTPVYRIGRKGLRLNFATDTLDPEECSIIKNVRARLGGPLETRPGQSTLGTTGAGQGWAAVRLDDTARGDWTRYVAAGSAVTAGRDTGTGWTNVVSGLSGNPPSLVPFRSALTGDPWLIIADSTSLNKVRKVGAAYEVSPLGLIPPVTMTSAISDLLTTSIAAFDASDGTVAATWTPNTGVELETPTNVSGTPVLTDAPGLSGDCVEASFTPGSAATAYYASLGRAKSMDLTTLQGGAFDASDQDYIRLLLRVDQPENLAELRVYFVCSTLFDPTVIPGTDAAVNTDAFVKAIRSHDYAGFTAVVEDAITAAELSRDNTQVQGYLGNDGYVPPTPELNLTPDPLNTLLPVPMGGDPVTGAYVQPINNPAGLQQQTAPASQPGAGAWSELGRLEAPLRRGEFMRIGNQPDRDWSTITGIFLVAITNSGNPLTLAFDDWFLTGGFGPDSGPTEAMPYDWRATHYDTRTGAESNGSPIQADVLRLQPQRQRCTLTAPAYVGAGASYMRQRFYRRGGLLPDDWYYVGQSSVNGGQVIDTFNDTELQAAGTLFIDNDVPIQTVDLSGNIVTVKTAQLFGTLDEVVYAVGDPYRAGTAYWSKTNNPDAWPVDNQVDVCPASEKLVNGIVLGDAAYVFSTARLYALLPNVTADGASTIAQPTQCSEGLAAVRGLCKTPMGIAFVATDGVRLTSGGPSQLLSGQLDPLFRDQVCNGFNPVDLTEANSISLTYWDSLLWFTYKEQTSGTLRTMVYDMIEQTWWCYEFAVPPSALHFERVGGELLMVGASSQASLHTGIGDNGTSVAQVVQTGGWDFQLPRIDKQMGDIILDADWDDTITPTLTSTLNNGVMVNGTEPAGTLDGRRRYHFEPFGIIPQRARNITLLFNWTSATSISRLYFCGVSHIPEPDQTLNRPEPWDDLSGGTGYLTGMLLTCDTGDIPITVIVECTVSNQIVYAYTATVQHNGRKARYYSWPVLKAEQVRLRPANDCLFWMFYDVRWITAPEPPNIAVWDSNPESKGDTYYTGLNIVCDTFGQGKVIVVSVDGVDIHTQAINANGKQLIHLTFGSGRGHVYRFRATDSNTGRLYSWEWMLQEEPNEQTNWNQNYTLGGTLSDKWVKGVLLECDTNGEDKTVEIQVDQVTVETITVNTTDRQVRQFSFPQSRGRVFRLWPTDNNPGRLYSLQWIFDEEPLGITRWETQEIDHGIPTWFMPLRGFITIRSSVDVSLTVTLMNQAGTTLYNTVYVIPSTGGAKVRTWVPFQAGKGTLVKYLVQSAEPFWLYREESHVLVQPLGGNEPAVTKPLGNDDLDPIRAMGNASVRAATPNSTRASMEAGG